MSIVRIEPAALTRPNDVDPNVVERPEKLGVFERF
jgi:hypothetical protein